MRPMPMISSTDKNRRFVDPVKTIELVFGDVCRPGVEQQVGGGDFCADVLPWRMGVDMRLGPAPPVVVVRTQPQDPGRARAVGRQVIGAEARIDRAPRNRRHG